MLRSSIGIAKPSFIPKLWPLSSNYSLYHEGQKDATSSIIKHLSGRGNHGVITDATWVRGDKGLWLLSFDSANPNYVSVTQTASVTFTSEDFSIVLWAYFDDLTEVRVLVGSRSASGGWMLYAHSDKRLIFSTHQGGTGQNSYTATNSIEAGWWYNLGVSRTGSSIKIYINGVDSTSPAGTHIDPVDSEAPVIVGVYYNLTSFRMNGDIALLRILKDISLSSNSQLAIYNQERHLFGV